MNSFQLVSEAPFPNIRHHSPVQVLNDPEGAFPASAIGATPSPLPVRVTINVQVPSATYYAQIHFTVQDGKRSGRGLKSGHDLRAAQPARDVRRSPLELPDRQQVEHRW